MSVVQLARDERGVATITIARPEVKNAFDAAVIAGLADAVARVDPDARAVVLRSAGDVFCAGADLNWMRATFGAAPEENERDSRALAAMYAAFDALPMPLVARVQGHALGGGAGLVAVADLAIASRRAAFAFSEVRLGILPAVISPYVVRKIGPTYATAAFVTGARFDAQRAYDIGLVHRVCEPDALDATVEETVAAIIAGGPEAVRAAKRLVREVAGRDPADVRELTIRRLGEARVSEEGQEGVRAFLERRPPRWPS